VFFFFVFFVLSFLGQQNEKNSFATHGVSTENVPF
jgi:hypothetical protein